MTTYLSCAETAKILRSVLKESFPKQKFSVKSETYAGGASIRVCWVDGPTDALVKQVIEPFEGAYFDGMTDYKGNRSHMFEGKRVSFGADFIFCERDYSPALIEKAITAVYTKYLANFEAKDIPRPTVEDYKKGELYT